MPQVAASKNGSNKMKKYESLTKVMPVGDLIKKEPDTSKWDEELSNLGKEGWKLIAMTQLGSGGQIFGIVCIFERELQ